MNILQLSIQFIITLALASKVSKSKFQPMVLPVLVLLNFCQFTSVYITGNLIDQRVMNNLTVDALYGFGVNYRKHFLIFFITYILSIPIFQYLAHKSQKLFRKLHKSFKILSIIALLSMSVFPQQGILRSWFKTIEGHPLNQTSFEHSLKSLGISPEEYIFPNQLVSKPGKNIIVLSLESIERGYLTNPYFADLTPNLRNLSQAWSYIPNLEENIGGNWTIASLYSYQVGVPAIFNSRATNYFQGLRSSKITGLGHILENAGYRSSLIISDPHFAGTKDLMTAYNIRVISSNNSLNKYKVNWWGLSDIDIFEEAKNQIHLLKDNTSPFALFISTINSHGSNGLPDQRVKSHVNTNRTQIEQAVQMADKLVGEFISYLKDNRLLSNSAIFIFPDHKLISEPSKVTKELSKRNRSLFLISNVLSDFSKQEAAKNLKQIQIPALIIKGANIQTNGKFLSDLIDLRNNNHFIEANYNKIANLNSSAISKNSFNKDLKISIEDRFVRLQSGTNTSDLKIKSKTGYYEFIFNKEFVLLDKRFLHPKQKDRKHKYDRKFDYLYLTVEVRDGRMRQITYGNKEDIFISKRINSTEKSLLIKREESLERLAQTNTFFAMIKRTFNTVSSLMRHMTNGLFQSSTTPKTKIKENNTKSSLKTFITDKKRFIAHAGGSIDGKTYTNSLEALNISYKKGLRYFELDIIETSDNHYVAVHGWKNWLKKVSYKGPIPPTKHDFMRHKIFGKYTPVDMETLNLWFEKHKDAVLVTDKVDQPKKFSAFFKFKDRLMMEVFSWDSAKEALSANIAAPILNFKLVKNLKVDDIPKFLKNKGYEFIASSRNEHTVHLDLIKNLNKAGIKIYAYGFHSPYPNEKFLICNQRELYYGAYVDRWDSYMDLDCSKENFESPTQDN